MAISESDIILNCLILYRRFRNTLGPHITPDLFEQPIHKECFRIINKYSIKKDITLKIEDIDIIVNDLEKNIKNKEQIYRRLKFFLENDDIPTEEIIMEKIKKRLKNLKAENLILDLDDELEKDKKIDYNYYADKLNNINDLGEFQYIEVFGSNVKQNMQEIRRDEKIEKIPLGIKGVEHFFKGGIAAGELLFDIAPSGYGKTALLASNTWASLTKVDTLVISLELKVFKLLARIYRRILGFDNNQLLDDNDSTTLLTKFFNRAGNELVLTYFKPDTLTPPMISNYIDYLYNYKGIKIKSLKLDYFDKLQLPIIKYRTMPHTQLLRVLADNLRNVLIEKQIAGETASQTNKKATEVEHITEKYFGEAYAKYQVADLSMSLNRTELEQATNWGRLRIIKNREGAGKGQEIPVIVDLDKMIITDKPLLFGPDFISPEKPEEDEEE